MYCAYRQLCDVLSALAARKAGKLLLACNKSDLGAKAFSEPFIVKQLEKEMCAVSNV